ncbi:Glycosyltransferase involved in cell wall bisynthesis [Acetitomaculum ruminis DSM 5522]|uniref:Glycosyltransferase involved in cell wall bisynthesis n=1 Tax=Acetitomaculum ruminis DSM 5522 TaxID=1120918 RepID=A0A1I0VJT5_9FIRM|nr:glycosyltransferase [Acetitomaculum ruminis]SFA76655.1 Glycosyltransferase involved in cell wall bisynthesis [Acetitomaculum ruminis DSM 5522]
MKKPLISVIMGVYNQFDEKELLDSVISILNQSFWDFEFIIWDDGSDKIAKDIIEKLPLMDERIIIAGKNENQGLAFSLNECIKLARGKYIARMDADDISLPNRLKKQYEFLEKHSEYAWCGTNCELFDEEGVWGLRLMSKEPYIKDYYKYSPFIHPSVMFRKELFEAGRGYLETKETLRCEDYEIFLHLTKKGLKGYNLEEILFRYRESRQSYKKRTINTRINEAKIRYRNFKELGILFPKGWFYVLRPVFAILLPSKIIEIIKRYQGISCKYNYEREYNLFSTEVNGLETAENIEKTIKQI